MEVKHLEERLETLGLSAEIVLSQSPLMMIKMNFVSKKDRLVNTCKEGSSPRLRRAVSMWRLVSFQGRPQYFRRSRRLRRTWGLGIYTRT